MNGRERFWRAVGTAILAPALVFASSGCAALFNPDTQALPVTSSPPGVEVWLDGEMVGVTPVTVEVDTRVDHELILRYGERESVWLLQRRFSDEATGGLALDIVVGVPIAILGTGAAIVAVDPCSGSFNPVCENPALAAIGIGIAVLGLTPIVVDVAINDFYELVPMEIDVEFD